MLTEGTPPNEASHGEFVDNLPADEGVGDDVVGEAGDGIRTEALNLIEEHPRLQELRHAYDQLSSANRMRNGALVGWVELLSMPGVKESLCKLPAGVVPYWIDDKALVCGYPTPERKEENGASDYLDALECLERRKGRHPGIRMITKQELIRKFGVAFSANATKEDKPLGDAKFWVESGGKDDPQVKDQKTAITAHSAFGYNDIGFTRVPFNDYGTAGRTSVYLPVWDVQLESRP